MFSQEPSRQLENPILEALIEIPLRYDDLTSGLSQIAELGRKAMESLVCSITIVDLEQRHFVARASAGIAKAQEQDIREKHFALGSIEDGEFDFGLISRGEVIQKFGLEKEGQGVAKAEACRRHGIHSLLAMPLLSGARLLGYINHFSAQKQPFSNDQKRRLDLFAKCTVLVIEKLERLNVRYPDLDVLNAISQWLLTPTGDIAYLCNRACELMRVSIGIIWRLDEASQSLRVITASPEVDEEFKKIELKLNEHEGVKQHLKTHKIAYLSDVRRPHEKFDHSSEAARRGWISLLSKSMHAGQRLIGMFDIYTKDKRTFMPWEHRMFDFIGNQLALYIERAELSRSLYQAEGEGDSEADLETGLKLVVRELANIAKADYCRLRLRIHERPGLETRAEEIHGNRALAATRKEPLGKGEGIAGRVWQSGVALIYPDRRSLDFDPLDPGVSLLCVPIKRDRDVLGTITVGADRTNAFSQNTLQLLEKMLEDVPPAISRAFSREKLERVAAMATESETLDGFLKELGKTTQMLMRAQICIVWLLDKKRNGFVATNVARVGQEGAEPANDFITREVVASFLRETQAIEAPYTHSLEQPEKRLAVVLRVDEEPAAILEVGGASAAFTPWRRSMLQKLGKHASAAIKNLGQKNALEQLNKTLAEITAAETKEDVISKLLTGTLTLLGSKNGSVKLLDYRSEMLNLSLRAGETLSGELRAERGVTGHALNRLQPIRLGDVTKSEIFYRYWQDTVSELAVPIYVKAATVRKGTTLDVGPRPIGVLNVESPTPNAYSQFDQECLMTLASHAAIALDRIEFDEKLMGLNRAEADLASMVREHQDWDVIVAKVIQAITTTLGYSHVNLSLLSMDGTRIKTEHVGGTWLKKEEIAEFKKLADHDLKSDDIQAFVVKTQQIIVPANDDCRFDKKIHQRFRFDRLVRVYIPMVLDGVAVGTLEAGYPEQFKKHIYERDVQVLKSFVDYATAAIGQRRRGLLDKLSHEFTSAIRGIQSNASFLMRHRVRLAEEKIERKFTDILTDCDVLHLQVGHLEYFLTGKVPKPRIEMTAIGRDVVLKTIHQLDPELNNWGLSSTAIQFDYGQLSKVRAYVDKAQICEVMTNVFINAIKYRDPADTFRMKIEAAEGRDFYTLRIQDWGIGVQSGYEEKIFEEGFRTPEAIQRVYGTGYGLAISRQIMRQMGGDIHLTRNQKPTEFQVRLPKHAKS